MSLPYVPDLRAGQYYLLRIATPSPPGLVEQAYSVSSSPHPPSTRSPETATTPTPATTAGSTLP
ncbi:MAG: hypothetical protein ACP5P1_15175 [Acidimicrobiales bacterium]